MKNAFDCLSIQKSRKPQLHSAVCVIFNCSCSTGLFFFFLQVLMNGGSGSLACAHSEDDSSGAGDGVAARIDGGPGGEAGLFFYNNAAPFLGFQSLSGGFNQRVGGRPYGHDHTVRFQNGFGACFFYRTPPPGGIRFAQLHLHALHAGNKAFLVAQNFSGVVQKPEDDALLLRMLHLLCTGGQFFL